LSIPIDQHSTLPARIALFRDLFRGRDDVYPRRFQSLKTDNSGYQPACANEWVRDLCDKRRVRCAECPNRRFFPVTDETVFWHLSSWDNKGRDFVMGVYPMLQDETSFLLAVDFDKQGWHEDALAFLETCRRLGICASLERSRSGNGGHIWVFFDEPIQASSVTGINGFLRTNIVAKRLTPLVLAVAPVGE
jgi:hypothetical protein